MEYKELNEFIHFFTHNKILTREQKIKFDALLARDIIDTKLETKLKKPENDINNNVNSNNNPKVSNLLDKNPIQSTDNIGITHRTGIKKDCVYVSPKNVQKFLIAYNQDEILKYTCHLIDQKEIIDDIASKCPSSKYVFREHLDLIKKRFQELKKEYSKQNLRPSNNIIALISAYLTGKNAKGENITWSSNDIDVNWSSNELIKWSDKFSHIVPNPGKNIERINQNPGYKLGKVIPNNIKKERIVYFKELVIYFKNLFHLRKDNSLRAIFDYINNQDENWKNNVEISFDESFNDGVELFTDVDKLIQAYKRIVNICINCRENKQEKAKIILNFYDNKDDNAAYLSIHHINSIYRKTSKNAVERIGSDTSVLIEKLINGLCDLYIEATFGDNRCGRINLWDVEKDLKFEDIPTITGVKYILKF